MRYLWLLLLCNFNCISQIKYDYIESYNWDGYWFLSTPTSGYFTDAYYSSNSSAALFGSGNDVSVYEYNWYVLPNVPVDNSKAYVFSFRLASLRLTSTSGTAGVDASDYVYVKLSTDGGTNYVNEIQIRGLFNSYWTYNATGIVSKSASGSVVTYQPTNGGNQETTGKGFAYVELLISGVSNIAIDIYARANASGEEWWFDNFRLDKVSGLGYFPEEEDEVIYIDKPKKILRITNLLGQDVDIDEKGFVIITYEDGKIVKIFN